MSEISKLRADILTLERQIRQLRTWKQQLAAGDQYRANAAIGVLPSANIPAHGSIGLWTNQSGGALGVGTVVVQNGDRQFDTTGAAGDLDVVGVIVDTTIADTAEGRIRHQGYHPSVIVEGAVVAGQFLRTSTTAGAAEDAGATPTPGTFGIALTAFAGPGAGTVGAYLYGAAGGVSDHGALTGLGDVVDHPDYLLTDGSRNLTGTMLVTAANELNFGDADLAIWSSADGQLDLKADTEIELTSPTVDLPGGLIRVGVDDTARGLLHLLGSNADAGGDIYLYVGANEDAVYDYWQFGVKNITDDLRWAAAGAERMVLTAQGQLQVPVLGAAGGLLLGGDVLLYRLAANQFGLGAGDQLFIPTDGGTGGIRFGAAGDAFLYRGGANALYLESGDFLVLATDGVTGGLKFGAAGDVHMYRGAANELYLAASDFLRLATDGSGGGLKFGTAGDVHLYRSNADVLYTPDSMLIEENLWAAAMETAARDGTGIAVSGVLHEGYRPLVLASSPNGYWRLGESSGDFASIDNTGNDHTGTPFNTPTYSVTGALALDPNAAITLASATNEYFTAADHADFDLADGPWTLEAWIKKATDGATMVIFSKGAGSWELRMHSDNTLRLNREGVAVIVSSTITITGVGWHHVAATKNGAASLLYIDGVDVTGAVVDSTMVNTATDLNVGRHSSAGLYWNGSLDEVAVYPSVLAPATILAHYNRGIEGGKLTAGDLEHAGSYLGFYGATPVVQSAAYNPTNVAADRAYDADATTLDELADVLGTLIADLQATGLIG